MERWLSRSRVLLALCGVLLVAALNRRDPMVYGMFLFLAVVTVLGFVVPWMSLRSTTVRLQASGGIEVVEGTDCDLNIVVERHAQWPAFLVDVETEWEWAGQRIMLRQTLPIVRSRGRSSASAAALAGRVRFPCRGHYRLVGLRLSSGFPLGLVRAHQTVRPPDIALHVLPRAQPVHWPLPWGVAPDPLGDLTLRQMGQSFEPGVLRSYQHGDSVGRVNWRASARAGELVIQHFQQTGAIRLRVVVNAPTLPALGQADSAGEQAIRLAAGVCDAAMVHGVQLFLYQGPQEAPLQDATLARRALAQTQSQGAGALRNACARAARDAVAGEQVALVVPGDLAPETLVTALSELKGVGCTVVVCIALARTAARPKNAGAAAAHLRQVAADAGFATFMEMPA